jgi:hypothetical protein
MLLLGVLTSLLVVFIEGWVYQNLEVQQVNAYFWTMIAVLAFLYGEIVPTQVGSVSLAQPDTESDE